MKKSSLETAKSAESRLVDNEKKSFAAIERPSGEWNSLEELVSQRWFRRHLPPARILWFLGVLAVQKALRDVVVGNKGQIFASYFLASDVQSASAEI